MLQDILEQECYMLDIESTGLSPINNGMTSYCLVKFNPLARTLFQSVKDYIHNRVNSAISVDMFRQNDLETLNFRREHGIDKVEDKLVCVHSIDDMQNHMNSFLKGSNINHRNIFALHTEFDIAFLRGYFEHGGLEFPFKHRNIFELASVILGLKQDLKEIRDAVNNSAELEMVGNMLKIQNFAPHNALYDCIRQIAFLRRALVLAGEL